MKINIMADNLENQKLKLTLMKNGEKFISIELEKDSLKTAYLQALDDGLELLNYAIYELSESQEKYAQILIFLKRFLKENPVSRKEVYLTISDPGAVVLKHLVMPVVPGPEVLSAAKWQLQENFPFDLEQALLQWQVIREFEEADKVKKNELLFVIIKADVVDRMLSILDKCELNVLRISTSVFNYLNILKYSRAEEVPPVSAIINISDDNASLHAFHAGKLVFCRELSFSFNKLLQSMTGVIISDDVKVTVTLQNAENIVKVLGIPGEDSAEVFEGIRVSRILPLMRPALESLVKDIVYSFNYIKFKFKEKGITDLYICGSVMALNKLDKYLTRALNMNISNLKMPGCISLPKMIKDKNTAEDLSGLFSVLGAVLENSDALYMADPRAKSKKIELFENIFLKVISLAGISILIYSFLFLALEIKDKEKKLKMANLNLQKINNIKPFKENIALLESLVNLDQRNKVPADGLLKIISVLTPKNAALEELTLEQAKARVVLKGIMSGTQGPEEAVLVKFIEELEASAFFKEAALVSFKKMEKYHEFEIICDFKAGVDD